MQKFSGAFLFITPAGSSCSALHKAPTSRRSWNEILCDYAQGKISNCEIENWVYACFPSTFSRIMLFTASFAASLITILWETLVYYKTGSSFNGVSVLFLFTNHLSLNHHTPVLLLAPSITALFNLSVIRSCFVRWPQGLLVRLRWRPTSKQI